MSTNNGSLKTKVIKGGGWMILTRLITRVAGFAVSMVLARLLAPEAYGLVAVGTLTISLLTVFTEVGFQQSLIQKSGDIEPMLDTAWTVGVLRGIAISLGMIVFAPWIARFFDLIDAIPIVRVLSLQPFIYSLTNINVVFFRKELDFYKQFLYEVSAILGNLTVGIGLALLWQNAWALVFGQLTSVLIQVIVSFLLDPSFPKFKLNFDYFSDLYDFGKWVFLSGIVSYFTLKGDTFFVGRLFDEKTLGLYSMAYRIANIPVNELKNSLTRVLFPTYASIQNSQNRLTNAFITAYELLSGIMVPASIGLMLVAHDFVNIFLGDQWLDMVPLLRILGLGAATRALVVAGSGFTYGIGKPRINFYQNLGSGFFLVISLLILPSKIGILGVGWAVIVANIVSFLIGMYFITSRAKVDLRKWMLGLFPIFISIIPMVISVKIISPIFQRSLVRLIFSSLGGALFYFVFVLFLGSLMNRSSIRLFKKFSKRLLRISPF